MKPVLATPLQVENRVECATYTMYSSSAMQVACELLVIAAVIAVSCCQPCPNEEESDWKKGESTSTQTEESGYMVVTLSMLW